MINIVLNASVTGGITILLWYLTYPLSRTYFRASWHYAVLKIVMIFMLLPIGIFAPIFNNVFARLFTQPNLHISRHIQQIVIDSGTISSVNTAISDFIFPDVHYPPQLPPLVNGVGQSDVVNNHTDNSADYIKNAHSDIPYLQAIWLIVAATLIYKGILKIHRFKKQILTNSSSNVEYETRELFLQCKKQLKVHGKITLRTSEHAKTPFVFGLTKPIIVFPKTGMNTEEKRLAFFHELTHIKNGDLWLKFFAFFISAVHWFNPFAHLLCLKISFVSEEYCDECVVKTISQVERFYYGNLILKVVTDISAPQPKFCSTLSNSTKNLKRRLSNMMNYKKSRKSMVALSIIAAFIVCSLPTIYSFAANADKPDPRINITETNGRIREDMLYEFIIDEQVVGKWEVVDFVKNIDDFETDKQWWQGGFLFWESVEFLADGTGEVKFDTGVSNNDFNPTGVIRTDKMKWTNGLIELYDTIPEYTIKHINGNEYIFIQWKSGDYTIRKMNPYYYVFKKSE